MVLKTLISRSDMRKLLKMGPKVFNTINKPNIYLRCADGIYIYIYIYIRRKGKTEEKFV